MYTSSQVLPLVLVGYEVDGQFFYVYQETPMPTELDELDIRLKSLSMFGQNNATWSISKGWNPWVNHLHMTSLCDHCNLATNAHYSQYSAQSPLGLFNVIWRGVV